MSEQGVPIIEVTANDFMQVRAALVKRVGGANQALVFARVYYRTGPDSRAAIDVEGELWWQASHPLLAKETGLSEKQARDAIEELVEKGFVLRESHRGRVYSYRAVVIGYLPSGADAADEVSDPRGRSIRPTGQMHLPSKAVAPLYRQEDKKTGVAAGGTRIPEPFIVTAAMREWAAAEVPLVNVDRSTRVFVDFWRAATKNASKKDWVATWRNWLRKDQAELEARGGPKRTTVDHGRTVDEMLRAEESQRLAVTA